MSIRGTTQLLGVIGYPINHSLSPVMHNAALEHLGLDYAYLPFAVAPGELQAALVGLWTLGVRGFNVTIPHKQAVIPLLASVSDLAEQVGAVNTVKRTTAGWGGTNTDVAGFLKPLQNLPGRQWPDQSGLLLGCGGAARAVVLACWQLGLAQLTVTARDLEKLVAFQESWQGIFPPGFLKIIPWGAWAGELGQVDLVINATPLGMAPATHESPLSAGDIERLGKDTILYDLIYTPNPTRFLAWGKERGLTVLDGLEMLVQQGAAAFEWWLDQEAPVDIMRQRARAELFPN